MPVIPEGIAYAYTHETTQATTGYFCASTACAS